MNPIAGQFSSIEQVSDQYLNQKSVNQSSKKSDISFEEVLRRQQSLSAAGNEKLKFSKHATLRLESRGISLSDEQNIRLQSGVEKASAKGINESLVLVDSLAFIVNVPNKTVITAMSGSEMKNNIFTNIDGVVMI